LERSFEQRVVDSLRQARARKHPLLWTPGTNLVVAVVDGLREHVVAGDARPVITSSVADEWATRAVELLLAEEPQIDERDLAEAMSLVAERYVSKAFGPRSKDQLGLVFLLRLVERLAEERKLAASTCAALLLAANELDDRVVRLGLYALRPLVLACMTSAFEYVTAEVRHTDLVVAWKTGVAMARGKGPLMPGVILPALAALPEAIERRILETYDGEGEGLCPDGRAVAPARRAGRVVRAGELSTREPFRSLPKLRADVLQGLGLLWVETARDACEPELEKGFRCFEQAFEAFKALGQTVRAVDATVCAAECLDRLVGAATTWEERLRRLGRLNVYGQAQLDWVSTLPVPEDRRLELGETVCASAQRARCHGRLLALESRPTPGDEPVADEEQRARWIQAGYEEAALYLHTLREKARSDPWLALVHGRAACIQLLDFVADVLDSGQEALSTEAYQQVEKEMREVLQHFLGEETRSAFVQALGGALRSWRGASALMRVEPAGAAPLASLHRLQEAAIDFISLLGEARQGLTVEQLAGMRELLNHGAPLAELPVPALRELSSHEPVMLNRSLEAGVPLDEVLAYMDRRLDLLHHELADPLLSSSERALLSGWISHLVMQLRMSTEDLTQVEPERALALLDLVGASAFRAETLLYGQGETVPPVRLTSFDDEDMIRAMRVPLPEHTGHASEEVANLFANQHWARHELDFWSRLKMSLDVGREDPVIGLHFAPLLEARRTTLFEADVPREHIELVTGEPPDTWERQGDLIVVRQTPKNVERIPSHVARARKWLLHSYGSLVDGGWLSPLRATPRVTPERIQEFLAARPRLAIVVPGSFPECVMPFSVFHHAGGRVVRHVVGSIERLAESGPGFPMLMAFLQALGDDKREGDGESWQRLGEAFERVRTCFDVWARLLVEVLDGQGITEVLFLLRGEEYVFIPWEELRPAPGGPRLEERYRIGYLHTLAELPAPERLEGAARAGVAQFYGDGASEAQMAIARSYQEELARDGHGRPPISGTQAAEESVNFYRELRTASRVRFFLHGHHDRINPEVDRITLVDAPQPESRVDLKAYDLRKLPLAGVDSLELWACEGAAHGRSLAEHGVSEEPEDLTASFLLAGARRVVASRWHVPTLPSALLMERFSVWVGEGCSEPVALARARAECRAAFEPGGVVEQRMKAHAGPALMALAADAQGVTDAQVLEVLTPAFDAGLQELRTSWRAGRGGGLPGGTPNLGLAMERLARYSAPRPERIGAGLRQEPAAWVEQLIAERLRPFRNPMCWSGWRIVLRSLEDWRP
jgi:hypothetical protein